MEQKYITYAWNLLQEKNKLEELRYHITDTEENLAGFSIQFKNGNTISNLPASVKLVIKNTLIKELDKILKYIDESIAKI